MSELTGVCIEAGDVPKADARLVIAVNWEKLSALEENIPYKPVKITILNEDGSEKS